MEDGASLNSVLSLDEVHKVGTLSKLTLTTQNYYAGKKRNLMTIEGSERIKLGGELDSNTYMEFFQKSRDERIKDLNTKLENAARLKNHNQFYELSPDTLKT